MLARTIILAAAALSTGCASIVTGQNQSLSVDTVDGPNKVSDAECELTNDKGKWFVDTPGSVTVHRSYENLNVVCKKDGHEPGLASVKSSTKGMVAGNVIFGGVIGGAVDVATGAAYDYPPVVTIRMGEQVELKQEKPVSGESAGE